LTKPPKCAIILTESEVIEMFTVKTLAMELERLCDKGMGDRAVSFPIVETEDGYDGHYILVNEVNTKDALEVAVYLLPYADPNENNEKWGEVEETGNRRLEEEYNRSLEEEDE
jgi:hypothetical protein